MICEALREFVRSGQMQWQRDKSPLAITPKIIFSKKFIEETLLPLALNQKPNGTVHKVEISQERRRQIQEANAEALGKLHERFLKPKEE